MSKRKRTTKFDDSFEEVGKKQDLKLNKMNLNSRCR